MAIVCFCLSSSALNVSVSRGSSEPAPEMSLGQGFSVDQFNNVIESINVNVSGESMKWNALLGFMFLRFFFC